MAESEECACYERTTRVAITAVVAFGLVILLGLKFEKLRSRLAVLEDKVYQETLNKIKEVKEDGDG
jgi:hypothetical protein